MGKASRSWQVVSTLVMVAGVVAVVATARSVVAPSQFAPALARSEAAPTAGPVATLTAVATAPRAAPEAPALSEATVPDEPSVASSAPTPGAPEPRATPAASALPAAPAAVAPAVQPATSPTPRPTEASARVTETRSCGTGEFCYPRLAITGPIVPYRDCSGATDVGTAIRSFNCLSETYLMAHAYTQFGKITEWRAGDAVFAYGRQFTVSGAFVQQGCTAAVLPLAPLTLQTSLTSRTCGSILIVQAR